MIGKKYTMILSVLLIFNCMFVGCAYGAEPEVELKTIDDKVTFLKAMVLYIEDHYAGEVTEEELMEGAYKGVFRALDDHSNYFTPDEFDQFIRDSQGRFIGIGVTVSIKENKIIVEEVMEGAPSEKAGMKVNDVVRYIDQTDVSKMNLQEAIDLMLGELGTTVRIGVEREDHSGIIYFDIVRDKIEVNPVEYEILREKIGYIKLTTFNENASKNIDLALDELKEENISGIILDLRNNLGGILSEAVSIADQFIPKKPIVHVERKNEKRKVYFATQEKIDIPLVVLVNGLSASASEIVASAIQDTRSGILIGTKTYGKGTVQESIETIDGGGIKLTIAEYLTSNKRKIDGIGIVPDIVIRNNLNEEKDVQLEKAMEVLIREKIHSSKNAENY